MAKNVSGIRNRSPSRLIHSTSPSMECLWSPPISPPTPAGTTCRTPLPASATAVIKATSSSSSEYVPGTGCPLALRCPAVRPNDMPRAPARRPSVTAWVIAVRSSAVGASSARSPITWAHSGQRYLRADIDGAWHPLQRVEVLAEGLPLPRDPLRQRAAGDVLYALHQFDEPVVPVGPHRSETDAAIAHDRGGHAMPARRCQMRIPGGLTVEMRVDVDES